MGLSVAFLCFHRPRERAARVSVRVSDSPHTPMLHRTFDVNVTSPGTPFRRGGEGESFSLDGDARVSDHGLMGRRTCGPNE